jgi:regulator of protease activity HflC (stomatin/prohibitin superfamily)
MGLGLETALGWIGDLINWLVSWTPTLELCVSTDRVVKFKRGGANQVIEPSLFWYYGRFTEIERVNIKRQVLALETQVLTTKDKKAVAVGGVLVYSITDVEKYLVDNENADKGIAEIAAYALREIVVNSAFEDLQEPKDERRDEITKRAQAALTEFGIRVKYLRLSSHFAETKVFSHIGTALAVEVDEEEDE